jgi:hypothetical protein
MLSVIVQQRRPMDEEPREDVNVKVLEVFAGLDKACEMRAAGNSRMKLPTYAEAQVAKTKRQYLTVPHTSLFHIPFEESVPV